MNEPEVGTTLQVEQLNLPAHIVGKRWQKVSVTYHKMLHIELGIKE